MKLKAILLLVICLCTCFILCIGISANVKAQALNTQWGDPATITVVTDENRDEILAKKVSSLSSETYNPKDRCFQGMSSIEVTGNRIWTAWTVGGNMEPHRDNYIVIAYSDDGGKTWVDPFIIIDHDDASGIGVKVCVPNLWLAPNGELWCFYVQAGTCAIVIQNPTVSPKEIKWTQPRYLFSVFGAQKKPTIIKNANGKQEWLITCENGSTEDSKYIKSTLVYASIDEGKTWKQRGIATSVAADKRFQEAQIVQLESGRLWMLARIERGSGGGVEQYFSDDYGKTWGEYSANLSRPLIAPGSKFHITRLKSGNLLWVTNLSTSSRTNLTAFISKDEGESWSDGLILDDRSVVAYPDATYDDDGNIYVIWDRNRSIEQEIRFSKFNEQQLESGIMSNDNSRVLISKNHKYKEIVSIDGELKNTIEVKIGTSSSKIYSKLPSTITVFDETQKSYSLHGEWKTDNYNKTKTGGYIFKFECDLPEDVQDMRNIMSVRVFVVEDSMEEIEKPANNSSCSSTISKNSSIVVILVSVLIAIIFVKTKGQKVK